MKECLSRIQAESPSRIWAPVCNQTQQRMTLRKRTKLGTIQLVQSVTPLPFEEKENDLQRSMEKEASSGNVATSSFCEAGKLESLNRKTDRRSRQLILIICRVSRREW